MMASRRHVLIGCGAACIGGATRSFASTKLSRGCSLTPVGYRQYRSLSYKLFGIKDVIFNQATTTRSTGNKQLDRELDRALQIAADLFQISPAFGFFDPDKFQEPDLDGMNAFAWGQDVEVQNTRGLVGFGNTLFRNELFGYDPSGMTVMSIIAHEFGHNLQYVRGYLDRVSVLQCEINADFLAGYYLGKRKLKIPSLNIEPAIDLFRRLGRASDGNPNRSHGDTAERVGAMQAGYRVGYEELASLEEAVRAGWRYINFNPIMP